MSEQTLNDRPAVDGQSAKHYLFLVSIFLLAISLRDIILPLYVAR